MGLINDMASLFTDEGLDISGDTKPKYTPTIQPQTKVNIYHIALKDIIYRFNIKPSKIYDVYFDKQDEKLVVKVIEHIKPINVETYTEDSI